MKDFKSIYENIITCESLSINAIVCGIWDKPMYADCDKDNSKAVIPSPSPIIQ